MENTIIKLIDGGVIEIDDSSWKSSDGCETCGWGTEYTTDMQVYCTKYTAYISVDSSSNVSIGFVMSVVLNNLDDIKKMTEREFIDWFYEQIKKEYSNTTINIKEK